MAEGLALDEQRNVWIYGLEILLPLIPDLPCLDLTHINDIIPRWFIETVSLLY